MGNEKCSFNLTFVKNKNGFTLVEVLLSITLIFVIVFPLMGFFLQAYKYTMHSQDKTIAINVGRNVVNYMEKQNFQNMYAFLQQESDLFATLDWRYCFFDDDGTIDASSVTIDADGNRDLSAAKQSTINIDLTNFTNSKFNNSDEDLSLFSNGSDITGKVCMNVLSPEINGKPFYKEKTDDNQIVKVYLTNYYKSDIPKELIKLLKEKNNPNLTTDIEDLLNGKTSVYEKQLMQVFVVVNWDENKENIVFEGVISNEAYR
ncbi:MAG TPA: hypothetical protein GX497_06340 [Bacillus bacterium]|nr:hypothetical protein [Bacillus sp. (in: firmicutes)]